MPSLHFTGPAGLIDVQVEPSATLLDLRYQLFSLTDIPPERLVLCIGPARILPDDDADATRTLSAAGIFSTSALVYEDADDMPSPPPPPPPPPAKPAVALQDLQAALRACSSTKPTPHLSARAPQPDTASFIAQVRRYRAAVLEYEQPGLQEKARKVMPLEDIRAKAAARRAKGGEYATEERALAKELLVWFKESFFTWVNSPECWSCGRETEMMGMETPTATELAHRASRVERHECRGCGAVTRFPRYNDAAKLLETRRGRCGEWAQAFTLMARAAGLRVRAVHDWTDHVWTEVYCGRGVGKGEGEGEGEGEGVWVHADACENVLDEPLLYEKGWGKKLNYCVATGVASVMDVTRRYTEDVEGVRGRRTLAEEGELDVALKEMNAAAIASLPEAERAEAWLRHERDAADVAAAATAAAGAGAAGARDGTQLLGRQSGSAAWVRARGEDKASK